MTKVVSLGAFGLLGALAFSACSDDEDPAPGGGAGGTANAGAGGSGGAPSGGSGGAAVGGSGGGGAGGSGQQGAACPGCVRLDVPFTAELQGANYQLSLATPVDFSNTVVTVRFRVNSFAGNAGGIQLYVQNNVAALSYPAYGFENELYRNIGDFVDQGFQTITLDLNNVAAPVDADAGVPDAGGGVVADAGGDAGPGLFVPTNGFDKTAVSIIGLQVTSGGTFTGATFGTAQIDIDSFTFAPAGVTPDQTFATEADATAFAGVGTPLGTKTYVAE